MDRRIGPQIFVFTVINALACGPTVPGKPAVPPVPSGKNDTLQKAKTTPTSSPVDRTASPSPTQTDGGLSKPIAVSAEQNQVETGEVQDVFKACDYLRGLGECLRSSAPLPRRRAALERAREKLRTLDSRPHPIERKEIMDSLRWGAVTEPEELRKSIGALLIEAKVLSKRTAALIPSADATTAHLPALTGQKKHLFAKTQRLKGAIRPSPEANEQIDALTADDCGLDESSSEARLILVCRSRRCVGGCYAQRLTLQIRVTSKRWKVHHFEMIQRDDGSCGCCDI